MSVSAAVVWYRVLSMCADNIDSVTGYVLYDLSVTRLDHSSIRNRN